VVCEVLKAGFTQSEPEEDPEDRCGAIAGLADDGYPLTVASGSSEEGNDFGNFQPTTGPGAQPPSGVAGPTPESGEQPESGEGGLQGVQVADDQSGDGRGGGLLPFTGFALLGAFLVGAALTVAGALIRRFDFANNALEETMERAEPMVDDVNSAPRRELTFENSHHPTRAEPATRLRADSYLPAITRALGESGAFAEKNAAQRKDVIDRVGDLLADRLSEHDYARNSSGNIRWRNQTAWMLTHLKKQGQVEGDGRGRWWLTESGRNAYTAMM
jgi:hypothetical protein